MLTGLLATALLAPAQPPVPVDPPTQPGPMVGLPPSIDPAPPGVCPPENPQGEFSFNTTHRGPALEGWGGADYRMYWVRPAASPGVLALANGQPFGGTETEFGRVNGVGFTAGAWVNERHTFGLEGRGFLFEQKNHTAAIAGPGLIVRPFTDALRGQPSIFAVNDPANGITGRLDTAQGLRLSGFEVNGVSNLSTCCDWSADYIAGFRYLDLDEFLAVTQTGTANVPGGLPYLGTRLPEGSRGLSIADRFRTRNQFFGGQVGLRGEVRSGGWFADLSGKVGIGNIHQRVDIDGRTDVTAAPPVAGGFLAVPGTANQMANLGSGFTNRFAVLVDIGLSAGYQFAAWGRAKVGYDFLYLNDVARPGQQVDPVLNSRLIPTSINYTGASGLPAPLLTRRTDDFFAHGLRFGVELMY